MSRRCGYGPGCWALRAFGWLFVIGVAGGLVTAAVAWPLFVHAWPLWARIAAEVAWVLAYLVVGINLAGRRGGHAKPEQRTPPRHAPTKAAPGPRDWSPHNWLPGRWN